MLGIYKYIFITLSSLPQLDLLRVYALNLYSQNNNQLRKVYQDNIHEIVSDWFSTGIKIIMVTFILSCSLLQILLLLYFVQDKDIESDQLVYIITELIFVTIFFQHIIILIYDATQYGLTTISSRINFTVTFICSSFLSYVLYDFGNQDIYCSYLSYAQSLLLFLNCLLININPTDYQTKAAIIVEYIHMKQRGQTSLFSTENNNEPREQLLFYKNDNCATFSPSEPIDDDIIQEIHIKQFKESQKYEKRTIIYQIGYNLNKQQRTVFRSFREFLSFHHDLKMEFPYEILPIFPNKKNNVKFLSLEDVMARQELLDQFLKGIVVRFNKHVFLGQFLNSGNDTPQYKNNYGGAQPRRQQRTPSQNRLNNSNRQITYASIPETIWEGIGDEEDEVLQDERKEKKRAAYSHDQNNVFDSNPQNGDYMYKSPQFNGGYKVSLSKTFEQYANENLQNDSDNEDDRRASPSISFQ